MRDNKFLNFMKDKTVIIALVVCVLAAAVIAGVYTMNQSREDEDTDYIDLSELQSEEENLAEANTGNVTNTDPEEDAEEEEAEEPDTEAESLQEDDSEAAASSQVEGTIMQTIDLDFTDDAYLNWPIDGNVIMNYSMDKTTYFSTLDVYKYNPAIIISGEVNTKVMAAANGKVTDIAVNEETGNTITFDLGNGYEAVYGQLKEIPLEVGDVVETNEVIGYVSEPTKYYTTEGSNLYFQLLKDGDPVNPMSYLE